MTYERAAYFKLLLLCGYRGTSACFIENVLIEKDLLSDIVLKLSSCVSYEKRTSRMKRFPL